MSYAAAETFIRRLDAQRRDAEHQKLNKLLLNAAINGHIEAIPALITIGANVEARDNYGNTPLYIAALNEHLEAIEVLLANGANIETTDNNGRPL